MVQLCPDDDGEFCVVLEIFLNGDTILFLPVVTTTPGFMPLATFENLKNGYNSPKSGMPEYK